MDEIIEFSDASYAEINYGAFVTMLAGILITWRCGKQDLDSTSTCENELYAGQEARLGLQSVKELLIELIPQSSGMEECVGH